MAYQESIKYILSQPELPVEKLSGCNILITGATGLIGSALVDSMMGFEKGDYLVYALGRNEERAKRLFSNYWGSNRFHFIKHDVMYPLNSEVHFHYIIHAASNANPSSFTSSPVEIIKSNIFGLSNLLDYGQEHGLRRLLYVSSGEVYGEGEGKVFEETAKGSFDQLNPRSCYPIAKSMAENLCVAYSREYSLDSVIARPCHVYGPKFTESDNRVYAQFLRNVVAGEDIVMKSTGDQYRSWCYVVDCVSALFYILLKGQTGNAYNVVSKDSNLSIKDLAELISKLGGQRVVRTESSEAESRGYNPVHRSIFDMKKLIGLGWMSRFDIVKGMTESIDYLKST